MTNNPNHDPNYPSDGERPDAASGADNPGADIAREAAQIAALQSEIAELKDRYLRAVADTENLRKRAEREKQDAAQFAFSRFARDLLAVADNFERALDAMKPEARAALSPEALSVVEGIEATQRQLMSTFERIHELGMLLALGATPGRLIRIIVVEALALGLVGVLAGSALGGLLVALTHESGVNLAALTGGGPSELSFMGMVWSLTFHPTLTPFDFVTSIGGVAVVSLLAALWPAARVARLQPIAALRA